MVEKVFLVLHLYLFAFICEVGAQNHINYPHLIYIFADDLGWNDVGFHGSNQIPTPNIDALAYRGIILNSYYVQPVCTPSRCALLTGKYPIHTGMQHGILRNEEPRGLPLSEKLLPEYLKTLGYSTHAVGKWHIGFYKKEYTPEYRGFDSYVGHWTGDIDYYDHSGTEWHPSKTHWGLDLHRGLEPLWDMHGKYLTEYYTEEAVKIINSHAESFEKSKEEDNKGDKSVKPLFLYLSHAAVHSGSEYNSFPAPEETVKKFSYIEDYKRRRYAAMLHWLDESVGSVVKALADNRMLGNSIIVFSTDNGGETDGSVSSASNWPLRGGKYSLWEGGIRGAASIWSPLLKKRGRVAKQLMHITDWLPTLLSAVNGSAEGLPDIDGFDSWKALSEDIPTHRTEVLLNIDDIENYSALRVRDWKVINGKNFNDSYRGWYGASGLDYEHNVDLILNSTVSKAMDTLGYFINVEQIQSLRDSSKVSCEADNASLDDPNYVTNGLLGPPIPCNPILKPCLFNIKLDPCEKRNLAELYPKKLEELMAVMDRYNSTAVLPSNTQLHSNANPALWGYTWTNYGDMEGFLNSSSNRCN